MKCITIRQPWAHAIVHMGKTIENRTWSTTYRGPVAIHAASTMTSEEYRRFAQFIEEERIGRVPNKRELPLGGIVGVARIANVVEWSTSKWFFGPYGFVLRDARPVGFLPMSGKLNIYSLEPRILATLARAA